MCLYGGFILLYSRKQHNTPKKINFKKFFVPLFSPFFPRLPIFMVTFPYMELHTLCILSGFPGSAVVKNLPANVGDTGSIPGSGRSPGEGNGNPLQYCCLEESMERGAWWAIIPRVTKRQTE